ncbi:MAG: protein kinase domain-containing protein [Vicinamibacterales bacterium]
MPRVSAPSGVTRQFSSGPLENGQIINGRYHVIRMLGKGGMGAVYHAWDEELGVGVALKVILPSQEEDRLGADDMERRLKKELVLARQITHRNVVRIHDIGEFDGIKFISMPYIKGQDLATILRSGPLPAAKALVLVRQIVAGLAAAHEAGVIHRDLKPANIMIEEGEHALLMDFGIARSVAAGTSRGTLSGTVVGTIDYMAPEQARSEPVDARADIYAVGLILHEMLNGRRQLTGEGGIADLVSRMSAAPAPVRLSRPETPEALDALVTKCVQPSPADRFQDCTALIAALDTLDAEGHAIVQREPRAFTPKLVTAGVALVVVASGAAYWVASRFTGPVAGTERPPVSVLIADFDNRTGDAVFDGTLAQSLSLAMEGASFVSMFPRSEALRAARQIRPDAPLDAEVAQLVARREGIAVILAGTIGATDGNYVLRVRALEGATGKELSATEVPASSKDRVLPVVSRMAAAIRRSLGDATPESDQVAAAETFTSGSLEAGHEYSVGQEHFWAGRQDQAIAAYERAIALDPSLGRAYAGLAILNRNMGRLEEAARYFDLAVKRLDGMSERERYRTLGAYHLFKRAPDEAIQELETLISRFPGDTGAHSNLAMAHFYRRDMVRALEFSRRALNLYPNNIVYRTNRALYAMYAGDFGVASEEANRALASNPGYPKALLALAVAAVMGEDRGEATRLYTEMGLRNESLANIGLGDAALFEGRAAEAIAILRKGVEANGPGSASSRKLTAMARAHVELGQRRDALRAVEQAIHESSDPPVLMEAAEIYLELGRLGEASVIGGKLRAHLDPESRALGTVIQAELQRASGQPAAAIATLREAQKIADTWSGRLALARAFMDAEAWTEAYSSLQACLARRGEAAARFLDDVPTTRVVPPVYFYLGSVQEQLGTAGVAESFRTFLRLRHAATDRLAADARRRLTN